VGFGSVDEYNCVFKVIL